jgi:hypothetical protein
MSVGTSGSKPPQSLSDSEDRFLECRDLKHSWSWLNDFQPYRSGKKIVSMTRVVECTRCGSTRFDEFSMPTMEKVGSKYYPTPGYRIVGFKGYVPVSAVRREILARQKAKTQKGK